MLTGSSTTTTSDHIGVITVSKLIVWYETAAHNEASVRFYADDDQHAWALMRVWLRQHHLAYVITSAHVTH